MDRGQIEMPVCDDDLELVGGQSRQAGPHLKAVVVFFKHQ